jgi:hypothetical protein
VQELNRYRKELAQALAQRPAALQPAA